MKILFITHYAGMYGANRSLLNLLKGLKKYKVEPLVIVPVIGAFTKVLDELSIPYLICKFYTDLVPRDIFNKKFEKLSRIKHASYNLKRAFYLYFLLRNNSYQFVYSNSSVFFLGVYLSKLLNVPHVWHFREYSEKYYNFIPNIGLSFFYKFINGSRFIFFVSKALKCYYSNLTASSIAIYNGVATQQEMLAYKKVKLYVYNDSFDFCIVGQIHPLKGQLDAVKAFGSLKHNFRNIRLIIAGDGDDEYRSMIVQYISDNNIEDVYMLGNVDNPFEIFLKCQVALMCSEFEAMGRVTVEAMSCMTPVIGRDSGGTSELIIHNVTGLLYDGSIEGLTTCMKRLIEDRNVLQDISQKAWEWAYENVSEEKYSESIYKVLQQI